MPTVSDQFDVDLEDHELLSEIELLTQLIVAARPFDHHLSVSQVDDALGLRVGASSGSELDARVVRTRCAPAP